MPKRRVLSSLGTAHGTRTHLDQPLETPTQHVIQVGRLARKVVSCGRHSAFLCGGRVSTGITAAMIDCSPTDLHDGETLGGTLSACDLDNNFKRTSGSVALIKSRELSWMSDVGDPENRHILPAS